MEKYFHSDRDRSLQELENLDVDLSRFDLHLVNACCKLMKKPIGKFDIEDLRIMIEQDIGLDDLIPLALETLEDNIFAEGDCYCGDLLNVVLDVSNQFWESNNAYKI